MLELLWRGFTHWSMFVLGGVCYLLVGRVAVWCCGRLPMWFCCATNTLLITALEFVTGCLVNLHLGTDASKRKFVFVSFEISRSSAP